MKYRETQVGQLTLSMQNQSRDSFPSDTKNVTPRPRESIVHDTVGVYKSNKCHIEIILETKVGNERLWNPEFVVFKPRVQLSFIKKI